MIDLTEAQRLLSWAAQEVPALHGIDVDDTDGVANRRRFAADVSRDLLHLSDQVDLAAALIRQQYWLVKGYSP